MKCGSVTLQLRRTRCERLAAKALRSEAAAQEWMRAANAQLGGAVPEQLVDTFEGFERVLGELESLGAG